MARIITDKQALTLARKKWGRNAFIESRLEAQDADGRAKAQAEVLRLKEELVAIDTETKRRLAETDWYVELQERRKRVSTEKQKATSKTASYRFRVGHVNSVGGLAFAHIKGQGDTWREALIAAKVIQPEETES